MKLLNYIFNFLKRSWAYRILDFFILQFLKRWSLRLGITFWIRAKDHIIDEVYTSIEDLPIWNWNKIIEKQDLTFLYKSEGGYTERLIPIWENIQQEHLDEFGYSDEMKSRERLMLKIIRLNCKFIETRNRVILNFIKVAQKKLELKDLVGNIKFGKLLMVVTKYMGFRIDPKQFTVYEWYHTLNSLKDGGNN